VAAMAASSLCDDLEPATVRTGIRDVLAAGAARAGERVVVGGWVRTGREQGKGTFAFLELSDGSCASTLQVIVDAAVHPLARLTATGTSVLVEGEIKEPPEGTKQNVELKVSRVLEVGEVDAAAYPLPKGKVKLTLEKLRDVVHLRSRTNTVCVPFLYYFLLPSSRSDWPSVYVARGCPDLAILVVMFSRAGGRIHQFCYRLNRKHTSSCVFNICSNL